MRVLQLSTICISLSLAPIMLGGCTTSDEPTATSLSIHTPTPSVTNTPTESRHDPTVVDTPTNPSPEFEVEVVDGPEETIDGTRGGSFVAETDSSGGVLFYEMGGGTLIPDPAIHVIDNRFLFGEVYSGLTRVSSTGSATVEPELASTFAVSEDGLEHRFVLKKDLKFSDGTDLSATDVKWSWERALRPETGSKRVRHVLGDIEGADAVLSGESTELAGVDVIDELTLAVSLVRRRADFPALLADPVASVLKRDNVENWGVDWSAVSEVTFEKGVDPFEFREIPVGTGPFKIVEFDLLAHHAVLEPNEHYWGEKPLLGTVRYINAVAAAFPGDGGVSFPILDETRFDIRSIGSEVGALVGSGVATLEEGGKVVYSETAPEVAFLAFNTAVAPYDDVEFRRALVAAADANDIAFSTESGSPNLLADGIIPPSISGRESEPQLKGPSREQAQSAIAASIYRDTAASFSLSYLTDDIVLQPDFEILTANWREWLGLNAMFGTAYIHTSDQKMVDEFERLLENGTLGMRFVRVMPHYPDPHAVLGIFSGLFGENAESPEAAELEEMLAEAAAEPDAATRRQKYIDIEQHILDRALALPLYWDTDGAYEVVKEWIHGYEIPTYGGSRFKNVWIDASHPGYPADRSLK